jgi:hypothetical protein
MALSTRHLLGIKDLIPEDIQLILDTAKQFKEVLQRPIKKVPSLRDVTIVNLFTKILQEHGSLLNWQKKDFQQIPSISVHRDLRFRKERPCWIQ